MAINHYFEDELNYLRELGRAFSQQNPALSKFLSAEGDDPDVDRLFEGFAFLTGRIRQKLDDGLPEITHSLINLLWPNYLRPVPSMSILQFSAIPQALTVNKTIARGTEVQSVDVEQTRCQFKTCYDVDIYPVNIVDAKTTIKTDGSLLDLSFALDEGIAAEELGLDCLRLYLHCEHDRITAQTLYLWLFQYLESVEVIVACSNTDKPFKTTLPVNAIKPVGYDANQALLPGDEKSFSGYRLLQEYFQLPEKFLFFDIAGLKAALTRPWVTGFDVQFKFSRQFEKPLNLSHNDFRLFCTPIVNLFSGTSRPVRVDGKQQEYPVTPEYKNLRHISIFSVNEVSGKVKGSPQRVDYPAYESFAHQLHSGDEAEQRFYKLIFRPSVLDEGLDIYMAFVAPDGHQSPPASEVVSVGLTCTNRHLAETLRIGDICHDGANSPSFARFSNITQVTKALAPPTQKSLHWYLVANLALHYQSLGSLEALRLLLRYYDFAAFTDVHKQRGNRQMAQGIEAIEQQNLDIMVRGVPVRGLKTTVSMRESLFGSRGLQGEVNLYQFACMLNRYFKQYAPLNSFHRLEVKALDSGETWQWDDERWQTSQA